MFFYDFLYTVSGDSMKVTTKGVYGLEAMMVMALEPERCFSLQAIASARKISVKYLEQILHTLKQANLIDSERGKLGGYRLTRPAHQITVNMVLAALDQQMDEPQYHGTKVRQIYEQLQIELDTVFDRITLGALAQQYQSDGRKHDFVI